MPYPCNRDDCKCCRLAEATPRQLLSSWLVIPAALVVAFHRFFMGSQV